MNSIRTLFNIDFNSVKKNVILQGEEAKLGIFLYNNKRLYHKTKLILIKKINNNKKKRLTQNSKFTQYDHFLKLLYQHAFQTICMPSI